MIISPPQGICHPLADLAPLQVREDAPDAGGGLDPRPALLAAPGELLELLQLCSSSTLRIKCPAH